jgi:hypothetical protein
VDPQVEIHLIGPGDRRVATREVLGELVGEPVRVQWHEHDDADIGAAIRRGPADDPALAHVHVDLRDAPLLVYIADQGHIRVLIRRVELPLRFDEVAREEVGAIVASTLAALCAGGKIGILRVESVPALAQPISPVDPAPSIAAPAPAPAYWSAGLLARYRVLGWAPMRVQHALEVGAALRRLRGRLSPQLGVWAGSILPGAIPGPGAPRIGGATLRLELGAVLRGTARWSQTIAAAGGIDLLRGLATRARWIPLPMLQVGLGLRAALGRAAFVELQAQLAVDLVDTRVLDTASGAVLFDPWRLRPGLALALGWMR